MIKICPQCGNQFQTYSTTKKFCSRVCATESRKIHRIKICPVCGKEFEAKKKTQQYCSIKCSSINQQSCRDQNNTKTRLHQIWSNMKTRCNNTNCVAYKDYGGRGITICEDWQNNFASFYNWALNNGYSNELSIDRINVDGNYEPNNCRWATVWEQARNRRHNRLITYNEHTYTSGEWARKLELTWDIIDWRLNAGWSIEEALFTPRMKNHTVCTDGRRKEEIDLTQEKCKYNNI